MPKREDIILFIALISFMFAFIPGIAGIIFLIITLALIFFAVFPRKLQTKWKESLGFYAKYFGDISRYIILIYFVLIILQLVMAWMGISQISSLDKLVYFAPPAFMIGNGIFSGIWEEAVFRFGILNAIRKALPGFKYKDAAAVILVSLLFGIMHFLISPGTYNIFYIIPTFAIGVLLSIFYIKKGLVQAMWLHSLYNTIAMLYAYYIIHGGWF